MVFNTEPWFTPNSKLYRAQNDSCKTFKQETNSLIQIKKKLKTLMHP